MSAGESSADSKKSDPVTQAKCKQLLDSVMKLKNGDRLLCEFFIKLPDKKVFLKSQSKL